MSDWSLKDLEEWDKKISDVAKGFGLDWFPIIYETCDYYEMIGHMSYHGMPSHYPHWSFGKSFERTHQMYSMGVEGLPYELIINSNPSIAYLMRENPIYLQVLIMAHCVGHSDFFKNNRTFSLTSPDLVVSSFRNARNRIQEYVEDPSIGIEEVEKIIDAAHTVQFQTYRYPREYISNKKKKEKLKVDLIERRAEGKDVDFSILEKIPVEPEHDILEFILEHNLELEEWQRDILEIVKRESNYFLPQIKTKIMNEGWASWWHYRILHELDLPQKFHLPFLKSHNQVIRPHLGAINPYHLGFYMFTKIEERYGIEECFLAREVHHDESFLRQYLTEEDCIELNLFSYAHIGSKIKITDISDEEGWKLVKEELIKQVGVNSIPIVYIDSVESGNMLILHHEHDGRDLEIIHAEQVVEHIGILWKNMVKLLTILEDEPFEI